jgi:hypothetical protein
MDPAFGIRAFVRPMPPKLVVLHELCMLPIHRLPIGTAGHIGIEHPALDGEAPFGEVLPGMPPHNRGPADAELLQAGAQGQKHTRVVADDGVRRAPLRNRLAADLDHAGEVLSIETARAHNRPAVPVEQQEAIEPMPVDLDQIPHIDEPDLMGSGRGEGTFFSPRRVRGRFGSGMGLFVEGHQLPDCGMPIPVTQGI